jgi:hypothetical protein
MWKQYPGVVLALTWCATLGCANEISRESDRAVGSSSTGPGTTAAGGTAGAPDATGGSATSASTGASNAGAGGTSSQSGSGAAPAEGASSPCQLLASVGVWYDEPQGSACTGCIVEMSGQSGVSFTSCSTLGIDCELSGCHDIWICLSEFQYAIEAIEGCIERADPASQALFLELVDCILPWCGDAGACAYSGTTTGCDLD